jgi:hypothetical protein
MLVLDVVADRAPIVAEMRRGDAPGAESWQGWPTTFGAGTIKHEPSMETGPADQGDFDGICD